MAVHIALLGDSIFDNGAYTSGGPDVITHLKGLVPAGWKASLLALDGSVIDDLASQLSRVPADVTYLVVSVGGNDVLNNMDVLKVRVSSAAEGLLAVGKLVQSFEWAYRRAIDAVRKLVRDTTVCTIYNGNLSPEEAGVARIGLMPFNDVILRVAFESQLRVIDLRLVCTEPSDYANPIEPSVQGGRKIARAIAASLAPPAPSTGHSRVYV